LGVARAKLFSAMSGTEIELVVGDAALVTETPNASSIDGLATLVTVNVFAGSVRIGGARAHDIGDATQSVSMLASAARTVFVVRGEDSASMERIFHTIEVLRRNGAEHVVLGVTQPSAPLEHWSDCPFPAAADADKVDEGRVTLSVELDDERRPAVVHVLEPSAHGFGGAAALCVVRQAFPAGAPGADGKPFRVRFER
jgi:hypothetical protein